MASPKRTSRAIRLHAPGSTNMASGIALIIMAFMYAVGFAGHMYEATTSLMKNLTPFILLLFALVTAVLSVGTGTMTKAQRRIALLWIVLTYLATLGLEIAGVATGMVFGEYEYGLGLGQKLLGVPLVIGLNWVIIVYGFAETMRAANWSLLSAVLLVPAGAVFFDIVLEPVAMSSLDYWTWSGSRVPLQNYVAWGLISFAFALVYFWIMPESPKIPIVQEAGRVGDSDERRNSVAHGKLGQRISQLGKHLPGFYVLVQFLFILALRLCFVR